MVKKKPIYINGKFLLQKITGVQRYGNEILKIIDEKYTSDNYKLIVLIPKGVCPNIKLKNIEIKQSNFLKGFFWEQFYLPLKTLRSLLINFTGSCPLIKVNQIVTIHDAVTFDSPLGYTKLYLIWYNNLFKFISKRVVKVVTVSKFSMSRLIYHLPHLKDKIEVAANGYNHMLEIKHDDSIFDRAKFNKNSFFLLIGSRNPNKNFKLIKKLINNYDCREDTFIVVGSKNNLVFKSDCSNDDLENFIFLENVNDSQLKSLFMNAKAFIFPSIYEGFGLPVIEALSLNCKVLSSDISSVQEFAYDTAVFFSSNNINDLYSKLKSINKSNEIDVTKGKWQEFTWTKSASKFIKYINKLGYR